MLTDADLDKIKPHLTVIPGRWPSAKVHGSMRTARAAITYKVSGYNNRGLICDCQLYSYTPDGWVLTYDIPSGTPLNDLPWKKDK